MRERILYHICAASISCGLSRISYRRRRYIIKFPTPFRKTISFAKPKRQPPAVSFFVVSAQDRLPKTHKSPWNSNKHGIPRASLLFFTYFYLFLPILNHFPNFRRRRCHHSRRRRRNELCRFIVSKIQRFSLRFIRKNFEIIV